MAARRPGVRCRIGHVQLDPSEYARWIRSPYADELVAGADAISLVLVDGDPPARSEVPAPGALPVVVAWLGDVTGAPGPDAADLVVGADEVARLVEVVAGHPLAATALAVHLRSVADLPLEAGLAAESALYSMLQAGPEFAAWRRSATAEPDDPPGPAVLSERDGDRLAITLNRPHRHNAITARLRDELAAALAVAIVDDTIATVELCGAGPSFCSGGDLAEFGRAPDPATAHRTRLARSPGRLVHRLGNVTARIHGVTYGGGIETAAFARTVVAAPDTRIALPEISLGLIPGAGGTVSLPRRIGRQRTAALALTGTELDAATAREWGLVDALA